ncbi:MAG: twin-arginine translocase TatA/TatE family subunit [Acidobacteria bacterium]|nr:twin-arginine translocase TatA/TatE family subunit [Acidobacteriota bacterium]
MPSDLLPALWIGPIGLPEWIILIALALLIFGGRRLGEIGRGLGEGIRNFRSAVSGKDEKAVEQEKSSKPS